MHELEPVLVAFRDATRCDAAVWRSVSGDLASLQLLARSSARQLRPDALPPPGSDAPITANAGTLLVAAVGGVRRTFAAVSIAPGAESEAAKNLRLLVPIVAHAMRGAQEVEHAARELAERYEEINLLYTISDILGRTVALEETAEKILTELSETVGARCASILVLDRESGFLRVAAAIGTRGQELASISIDDPDSVSARVYRTQHPMTVEPGESSSPAEEPYRRGEMLSVPIMWAGPSGPETLGVVNLSNRRSREPYSAGDQKLVSAIATQIGTAIQNARLVKASVEQQRFVQEMALAHDLQMKLLPSTQIVAPEAEVAARVVPAESVGGDFYHLFRLPPNRTGVMVGDVSGHGYRAALIMALAMSASAIHAQNAADPSIVLSMLLSTLREELATTEMFISLFFGVLDHDAATLRYANTGHPHAFIVGRGGARRLSAAGPPLGMMDQIPPAEMEPWHKDRDVLVLFTDGVVDARNDSGERFGEERVLQAVADTRDRPVREVLEHVFADLERHTGDQRSPDDLTLLVLRA